MKKHILAGTLLTITCLSGCAQSLPPHAELNQVFTRSFDASGFNYTSKSRITTLTIPKSDLPKDTSNKVQMALGGGLEILKGLSATADGAVDMKAKKSEVLYDIRYDRDNFEVSLKLPMLVEYDTQTIYVGTSVLTTILETMYPQAPSTKGKLIRININELLQEGAKESPELAKLLGERRLTVQNIDAFNRTIKNSALKAIAKLDDSAFSELPLTEQDRKTGAVRRIHVTLDQKDSVTVVLDLIEGISQALFQDGLIGEKELEVLRALTDRQVLDGIMENFTLTMTCDVGVSPAGFISTMESQLNIGDKDKVYQIGLSNSSSFSNFNAPRFTMKPEPGEIVDIKDIMSVIMADCADDDESEEAAEQVQSGS